MSVSVRKKNSDIFLKLGVQNCQIHPHIEMHDPASDDHAHPPKITSFRRKMASTVKCATCKKDESGDLHQFSRGFKSWWTDLESMDGFQRTSTGQVAVEAMVHLGLKFDRWFDMVRVSMSQTVGYCQNVTHKTYLSIFLSLYLSIHPSIYPSIDLSIYRSIYLSIRPSIYPSIDLSIYLYVYICIHTHIRLLVNFYISSSHSIPTICPLFLSVCTYVYIYREIDR